VATPQTLTSQYLAEVAGRGAVADWLVRLASEQFDLAATSYDGQCLTRPVFLEHTEFAVLRDDLAAHGLSYVDTMDVLVGTLRTECAIDDGARPLIAIADWPDSFSILEPQLRYSAALLRRYQLEAVPCHGRGWSVPGRSPSAAERRPT